MTAREAQLESLLLREKMRVSRAAFVALEKYGEHSEECLDGECGCGFDKCLDGWRLAAEGLD